MSNVNSKKEKEIMHEHGSLPYV